MLLIGSTTQSNGSVRARPQTESRRGSWSKLKCVIKSKRIQRGNKGLWIGFKANRECETSQGQSIQSEVDQNLKGSGYWIIKKCGAEPTKSQLRTKTKCRKSKGSDELRDNAKEKQLISIELGKGGCKKVQGNYRQLTRKCSGRKKKKGQIQTAKKSQRRSEEHIQDPEIKDAAMRKLN